MRIIDLALKDLRQIFRDRRSLLFLIVMPVVFTLFFGFAFAKNTGEKDSRVKIGIVNQDPKGILTQALLDLLARSATVRPVELSAANAAQIDQLILKGDLAAGLVIPADFSAATLRGDNPQLESIVNEESNNGQTVRRALQTNVTRLMSMVEAARLSAKTAGAQAPFANDAEKQAYIADAVTRALKAWEDQPLSIQVTAAEQKTGALDENPYDQFSPGMIVQFAIFGLVQAASLLVIERKTGAMARMLTTPMRKTEVIAGHILGMFVVFFAQQTLLVLFGQFVLKVDYLRQPLAVLCIMVALSLWVASLGLLISSLVKREDQVTLWGMLAMFLFSALGGAWFSLEMVGGAFAFIGKLTPGAWAITGFQNIILRGQGLESVLTPVAVLLAYTIAFFAIAAWRFKFE
jgi:ABC-2 type transport system permease protein